MFSIKKRYNLQNFISGIRLGAGVLILPLIQSTKHVLLASPWMNRRRACVFDLSMRCELSRALLQQRCQVRSDCSDVRNRSIVEQSHMCSPRSLASLASSTSPSTFGRQSANSSMLTLVKSCKAPLQIAAAIVVPVMVYVMCVRAEERIATQVLQQLAMQVHPLVDHWHLRPLSTEQ